VFPCCMHRPDRLNVGEILAACLAIRYGQVHAAKTLMGSSPPRAAPSRVRPSRDMVKMALSQPARSLASVMSRRGRGIFRNLRQTCVTTCAWGVAST